MKRALRILGWLLLGAVLVLALVYAALLFVNRHDQPPSEQVQTLHAEIAARPAVADADNAYLYMLGMGVAQGEDPTKAGRARIDWVNSQPAGTPLGPEPYEELQLRDQRSEAVNALYEACRNADTGCVRALRSGDPALSAWLDAEGWLLERYLALISHSEWREKIPVRVDAFLQYNYAMDGQRLLLARAWQLGGQGDAAALADLLQRDLVFWRRVLARSDILVTKMMAAAAVRRNFGWGSLAIQRLPPTATAAAIPAGWSTALTSDERSIHRPMAGEVVWMDSQIPEIFQPEELEEYPMLNPLLQRALRPLFQRQDTLNRHAILMMQRAALVEVPVNQLVTATARERAMAEGDSWPALPDAPWYNPVGKAILAMTGPMYAEYGVRLADLEGMRRLALLSVELHERRADITVVPDLLRTSIWKNPYTDKPFVWDSASGHLVFQGLRQGELGRYIIPYQPSS